MIIFIVVSIASGFFALSFYYLDKDRKYIKKEKFLERFSNEAFRISDSREKVFRKKTERGGAARILSVFMDVNHLEMLLVQSDIPLTVDRFIMISAGIAVLFLIPGLIVFRNFLLLGICFIIGLSLPFLYLIYRKKKREEKMVSEMSDAIDLMVRALRSGQSLDGALNEAGHSFPPPLGREIKTIQEEISLGVPFEIAMKNFSRRFPDLPEVRILTTAFIVQRETGGNLAEILNGLSETIRGRFKLKREVKALGAEGKMSSLILGSLPMIFAGTTYFLNPKYITVLFTHPLGKMMLLIALVLEAAGFIIMKTITRIEI